MYKCDKCGSHLQWLDTTDVEGSIVEGWLNEHMLWECVECKQQYYINAEVSFPPDQIKFIKKMLDK